MGYKLRWKKGKDTLETKKTWKSKVAATKEVNFIRQMDDDLPKSSRNKMLKTYRVVSTNPVKRRVVKRKRNNSLGTYNFRF